MLLNAVLEDNTLSLSIFFDNFEVLKVSWREGLDVGRTASNFFFSHTYQYVGRLGEEI